MIIGSHPHVIQPIEWVEKTNGEKILCAYSLGNLVAMQDTEKNMLGGVLTFDIVSRSGGEAKAENFLFSPTVYYYRNSDWFGNKIYYLENFTDELGRLPWDRTLRQHHEGGQPVQADKAIHPGGVPAGIGEKGSPGISLLRKARRRAAVRAFLLRVLRSSLRQTAPEGSPVFKEDRVSELRAALKKWYVALSFFSAFLFLYLFCVVCAALALAALLAPLPSVSFPVFPVAAGFFALLFALPPIALFFSTFAAAGSKRATRRRLHGLSSALLTPYLYLLLCIFFAARRGF